MRLFSARFRPSGKPFVAHLVGTASILARFGASVTVVTAGLLHAAYDQGDFGSGRNGITEAKRRQVHKGVGAEVEALIAGYTILQWNRSTFSAILGELQNRRPGAGRGSIDPSMENILLIRLANDLEDLVDLPHCTAVMPSGGSRKACPRSSTGWPSPPDWAFPVWPLSSKKRSTCRERRTSSQLFGGIPPTARFSLLPRRTNHASGCASSNSS
jgi:hypothetical protein